MLKIKFSINQLGLILKAVRAVKRDIKHIGMDQAELDKIEDIIIDTAFKEAKKDIGKISHDFSIRRHTR